MSAADVVASVAQQLGVDPRLALATADVESGLNPMAVGDQGTSFGLFQLHQGGELGSLTPQQAFDPLVNSEVALSHFPACERLFTDPGQVAACAQSPADPAGYAARIDALLGTLSLSGLPIPPGLPGGPSIGDAISGAVTSTGHGLADALGAGVHDLGAWARNQVVPLTVALIVVLVIFA